MQWCCLSVCAVCDHKSRLEDTSNVMKNMPIASLQPILRQEGLMLSSHGSTAYLNQLWVLTNSLTAIFKIQQNSFLDFQMCIEARGYCYS